MPDLKVMISHAHDEKTLAEAWKELLEQTTLGVVKVWFSSDTSATGGMTVGSEWRDQLYRQMAESNFIIAIQTPSSAGRPWIMWECGVASGIEKMRGIIPVVFAMGRGDLANPLTTYQIYAGDDAAQVREVCTRLAEAAGLQNNQQWLDIQIPRYLNAIQLHQPRRPIRAEQMLIWRTRFEELVRAGRVGEILDKRQAMYSMFTTPFKPVEPTLHELLSRLLLDQGHFAETVEEVDYAQTLIGDDIDLLHRKALALVGMQNLPAAQAIVDKLLADHPQLLTNAELAGLEGRIYRERGNATQEKAFWEKAYQAYLRAYQADRTQYYPGINAGSLALNLGYDEQAVNIFREVLDTCRRLQERPPVSFWVDFSAGEAYLGIDDAQGALAQYRQGLSRRPEPPLRARRSALQGAQRMITLKRLPNALAEEIEQLLR